MNSNRFSYYTGYEVDDEPSDDENVDIPSKAMNNCDSNSESDEFDEPIRKFMEKVGAQTENQSTSKSQSVQAFADEMDNELDEIYNQFISRGSFDLPVSTQKKSSATINNKEMSSSDDDDDNDDDDDDDADDDDNAPGRAANNEKVNDDLLYDPDEEEEDEKWMNQQRFKSQGMPTEDNIDKSLLGPTDAVLNCPGCMVLISHDCQRHETIKNQYRAMFVFNCKIDETRTVTSSTANESNSKRKNKKNKRFKNASDNSIDGDNDDPTNSYDLLRPVFCAECGTEIGVYEPKEELYHFANVLASH